MRSMKYSAMAAFALIAALAMGAAPAGAQALKGDTVTIMIGYSPGGSMDTTARLLSPFLKKHTPGNPTFIVKSMPGGGGVKVLNWMYEKASKNGRLVLFGPTITISQVLKQRGLRFDYKGFRVIGGYVSNTLVTFARKDILPGGLKKPTDIVKAKNVKQAGLRATAWYDLTTRLALDLLGVKNRYVPDYRGGAKIAVALRSGEANIAGAPMGRYKGRVETTMGGKDGVVTALWYFPFVDAKGSFLKDPAAGDIPTFMDIYRKIKGKAPSGQYWEALKFVLNLRGEGSTNIFLGPPGMDPKATADLRTGWQRTLNDPQAAAKFTKTFRNTYKPVGHERVKKAFAAMKNVDPKMSKFMIKYAYTHAPKKKRAKKKK